jgi:hypothetical protein
MNHTLSTNNAKYMCGDIKNFYLGTPMARFECMRLPIAIIPQEINDAYHLLPMVHNDQVYVEIRHGIYELPQAGIIANQLLTRRLRPHGYYQCRHTPCLWQHKWRPILFPLVVDDFGIAYVGKQHAEHLIQAIENDYEFTKDWTGTLYCGITIQWDYHKKTARLSMPGYIPAAQHKYRHPPPKTPQHVPHTWNKPTYGGTQQLTLPDDTTDLASEPDKKTQTKSHWYPHIIRAHCRSNDAHDNQHHRRTTIQCHATNHKGHQPTTRLLSHISQRHHRISGQRHAIGNSQRRLLLS